MPSTDLLQDADVRRWYENLRRDSAMTATERLRVLARLSRMMKTSPAKIVEDVRQDDGFTDAFEDFIEAQRKAGRKPGYLANYLKTVRSWLDRFGLDLGRKVKVGNTRAAPTLEDEQVPTQQQLRDLLMAASPRDRVAISFVAFAGLRPHVLGNYQGTDGLRLGDLEELQVRAGRVTFAKVPTQVRVRPQVSKAKHQYLTFLGEEGCEYLRHYLEARLETGEQLTDKSPIIRCTPGFEILGKRKDADNRGSPFIVAANIRRGIKRAMEKALLDARPYVLRRYFEMRLFNASWEGVVPRDWVTFWAGHKGDIEHVYTLHKGLPDSLIEKMRSAYHEAEPYLSTLTPTQVPEVEDRLAELVERIVEERLKEALSRGGLGASEGR